MENEHESTYRARYLRLFLAIERALPFLVGLCPETTGLLKLTRIRDHIERKLGPVSRELIAVSALQQCVDAAPLEKMPVAIHTRELIESFKEAREYLDDKDKENIDSLSSREGEKDHEAPKPAVSTVHDDAGLNNIRLRTALDKILGYTLLFGPHKENLVDLIRVSNQLSHGYVQYSREFLLAHALDQCIPLLRGADWASDKVFEVARATYLALDDKERALLESLREWGKGE